MGDLKTLAYCALRALDHMHQRGLVHGSVCTEDIVELGRCLRELADRGKVRFAGKFGGPDADAAKAARGELEGFVARLVGELPEGQEEGSPPPVPSAADALNDPYLGGVGANLPTEGQFTELAPMVDNSSTGLFDEDLFVGCEGMSPRKAGSYSPLPSCVSPHTRTPPRSPLAAPAPMRSLLRAENG